MGKEFPRLEWSCSLFLPKSSHRFWANNFCALAKFEICALPGF